MPKRILVTGGLGFIGTNLIAFLRNNGNFEIRVLDNESLGRREYLTEFPEVEFIRADLRDPEKVYEGLKKMDCVIHLAADTRVMNSIVDPNLNFENNVVGTFNLLKAMRRANVPTIINASTGGAILGDVPPPVHEGMLPEPASPYGASKLAVEGYLSSFSKSYGLEAYSLRFSNVYGPRSWHKGSVVAHFMKQLLRGKELVVYGDGSQKRDYIYVEDICQGILSAMQRRVSGVFQLGSGWPTTINKLIAHISDVVGSGYPVSARYEDFRIGEIRNTWCDISKAEEALGFSPSMPLDEGLARTWCWFLEHRQRLDQ